MLSETIAKGMAISQLRINATVAEMGVGGLQLNLDNHYKSIRELQMLVVPLTRDSKDKFERALRDRILTLSLEMDSLNKCLAASGPILEGYYKSRELELIENEGIN